MLNLLLEHEVVVFPSLPNPDFLEASRSDRVLLFHQPRAYLLLLPGSAVFFYPLLNVSFLKKKLSVSLQTPIKTTTRHCGLRSCKTPCLETPYTCTRAATGRRRRKGSGTCARTSSDGSRKELLSDQQRGIGPSSCPPCSCSGLLRAEGAWFLIAG